MCGICGVVGGTTPLETTRTMLARLEHRGPDAMGAWEAPGVALGHSRLAIVDTSASGNQPMSSEDARTILVCNGEIYNSPQLRRELEAAGHTFYSSSDNEVLLHLFEEEGIKGFTRINGMFACALWDSKRKQLILARDRLGIKPLYYTMLGEYFLFASEIKALLAVAGVWQGIDSKGLRQYLAYENTFGQTTLHANVHMVEPGQSVCFGKDGLSKTTYWSLGFHDTLTSMTFADACKAYAETARAAVDRHLMSDVPVASYLSSGIDSTTVAIFMGEILGPGQRTYTGVFGRGGWYNEGSGAALVSEQMRSSHTTVHISAGDFRDNLDKLIYALDEPRMGPGAFSQYLVARLAAKDGKVILTGHGGDEFFCGYPVFKYISLLKEASMGLGRAFKYTRAVKLSEWPQVAYFLLGSTRPQEGRQFFPLLFNWRELNRSLLPEVKEKLARECPYQGLEQLMDGERDPFRRLTLGYTKAYLPGLFVVEDKISMAHSLESRTPLCDNALVRLGLSLPLHVKMHHGVLKAVPKEAMRGKLPEALYSLPKRGFPIPLSIWMRGELRRWVRDRLLGETSPLLELFIPRHLKRIVDGYLNAKLGEINPLNMILTRRMWMLLSLDAWLRLLKRRGGMTAYLH